MHIAFFNRSFHPETTASGQLLTDLCEDLVREHGCTVSVVAGRRDGRGILSREEYRGIQIYRVSATNDAMYVLSACYAGLRLKQPDVVVALTDPPIIGLAAWLASLRFRAPLVMAFKDLFPALLVVNRFLVKRAAVNVALGETMRARLIEKKKAPEDKTIVIADWADTTALAPGPKRNPFSEAHGLANKFVVMHSGNLGLSQSLETVVDAAALLRDLADIHVVFVGEGVRKAELIERATALGLLNVSFLPLTPKERLGESFAAADVFVVSLRRGLAGYIVPSKLYGILAAGRPYVAAVDETCEVASITRRHECGLIAEPGDARALADRILDFYLDRTLAARAGANAREAGLGFDRRLQVAKYLDVFRELVRSARTPAGAVLGLTPQK